MFVVFSFFLLMFFPSRTRLFGHWMELIALYETQEIHKFSPKAMNTSINLIIIFKNYYYL